MKYIRNTKNNNEFDSSVFWVTMSDLMLGIAVIFIVLFVFAISGYTQNRIQKESMKYQLNDALKVELKKNNIEAEVDKFSGNVKISDLELFELNSWKLSSKGTDYLSKFIPIYFDTLFADKKLSDKIIKISIEGHTDSQAFKSASSAQDHYLKNLNLSLKRAEAISDYVIRSCYKKPYNNELIKKLSTEGKSFTSPVIVNGKEDYNKSRRVELNITFKDENAMNFFK